MLHYLFLTLSLVGTLTIYLGVPSLSPWLALPIALGCFVAVILCYFIFLIASTLFLLSKKPIEHPNPFCRFFVWLTMDWLMTLFRVRVELRGAEKLPDEPTVMVCNHRSNLDPMTMISVMRHRPLVYISKEANFKIPIVGPFIRHAGFVSIDRENGMRAYRALSGAAEQMKKSGVDVGIYPEGTRSKDCKLLRFKTGAFVLAKKAEAPIAVMAVKGSELVKERAPFRRTVVVIEVLEIVDRESVASLSADELSAKCRGAIEAYLQ